jgi:LysR family hca operon transcriptional activator
MGVEWNYDIFAISSRLPRQEVSRWQQSENCAPHTFVKPADSALEDAVGAQVLTPGARGIELTPGGRAFLESRRLMQTQVEFAAAAARRAAHPAKACFAVSFLTEHELTWMPKVLPILHDELPNIDGMISSQYSPQVANVLSKGDVDTAFLRGERGMPESAFRLLAKERHVRS